MNQIETANTVDSKSLISLFLVPCSYYCQCPLVLLPLMGDAFLSHRLNKDTRTDLREVLALLTKLSQKYFDTLKFKN